MWSFNIHLPPRTMIPKVHNIFVCRYFYIWITRKITNLLVLSGLTLKPYLTVLCLNDSATQGNLTAKTFYPICTKLLIIQPCQQLNSFIIRSDRISIHRRYPLCVCVCVCAISKISTLNHTTHGEPQQQLNHNNSNS